jgi:hypothetical protein
MITNFAPWQWLLGIFSALAIGVHRVPQRLFDTMIVLLTGISAFILFDSLRP